MKRLLVASLMLLPALPAQALQHHLLIVSGIGGIDSYRQQFTRASTSLVQAALEAGIDQRNIIVLAAEPAPDSGASQRVADKAAIGQALLEISRKAGADDRVFVVLIGHGNARGDSAVFNLPGPDISATELAAALAVLEDRLTIIINTASASGPFIQSLSRDNRIVITATSSSREYQATVFGDYLVAAFAAEGADRDKDERISMLEAFDYARREVKRSFSGEKRLLTEHALLDDNGDGAGSLDPGEFQADGALADRIYLQQPPSLASGASSELIAMLQSKQDLEQSISALKRQRDSLTPANYYAELERLLVELALLSREIRARGG
jgi:hypothetical protein